MSTRRDASPPLLRLLRAVPGPPQSVSEALVPDGASTFPEPDAIELVTTARRHALSAFVRHALGEAHISLPTEAAAQLQRDAASVLGTNLRLKGLLLRSLDALHAQGVPPPVLLKGYGLGLRLYPDPLLRAATDVDLLVEEVHLGAAQRALQSLGLQRIEDPGYGDYLEHHHHLSFTGEAGAVELHFRPSLGFGRKLSAEPLLARARPFTIEGRAARHASPEDELVYLAVHAAQHAFLRLSWLYDLKLLALREGSRLKWSEVLSAARASGMSVAVHTALERAHDAVGLPLPPEVLTKLPGRGWRTAIARRVFSETELVEANLASQKGPAFALRTVLCTGPVATIRHAADGAARLLRRRLAK